MHPKLRDERRTYSKEMLDEMSNLANNLNIEISLKKIIQIKNKNSSTLIGKGNLEKIKTYIKLNSINLLIINTNLSPSQQRNLEVYLNLKVTDRAGIIIEIFSKRAKSNEGKMQVELAELIYRKSRLVRAWTHLERQRGGTSFIGGPGELQIELDRRYIQQKILNIKSRLRKVGSRRKNQRKSRINKNFKTFALVGYTNAGKTKLFNSLTKKKQSSRNRLFETLDTKISRLYLGQRYVGIIDTVGFINNIPTQLIESFHATLEEIHSADFVINVVDVNDINAKNKIKTTKNILRETGIDENKITNMITVYNKIDLNNVSYKCSNNRFYLSALTGKGISNFKASLKNKIN